MNATGQAATQTVDKAENKELNGGAGDVDYEALASEIGWTPEEKFRGDKSKFIDAKTFYEKGEFVLPIVKKQRDDAKKHAEKVEKELAQVKSAMGDFQKLIEAAADRKESELKAEIATLKDARAAAVAAGDDKAFKQADDAIDERKEALAAAKEKPVKTETKGAQGDPEFEEWVKDNDWYVSDARKRRLANSIGIDLTQENPNLRGSALFKAVSQEMERIEAEKAGTERPGPQRGGKPSNSNSKAQTFDNLKPEFKEGYQKLVRSGIKITKEGYVSKCSSEAWGQ